jgi:hypothetical protein
MASSSKDCKRALSDRACLSSFCSWALVGFLEAALELTVLRIFWDSELSMAEEEDSRKADDDDFWLWAFFFLLYARFFVRRGFFLTGSSISQQSEVSWGSAAVSWPFIIDNCRPHRHDK